MPDRFVVATVNTQFSKVLKSPDGLAKLVHADILLLQEVSNPDYDTFRLTLERIGFRAVHVAGKYGLVIAQRKDSRFTVVEGSMRSGDFGKLNLLERVLIMMSAPGKREFTKRGIIAVKLSTPSGLLFTIATTHPAIDLTPNYRARQIKILQDELANEYYDGPLILAGDMNHHPGPKPVDMAMRSSAKLQAADLQGQATWITKKSLLKIPTQLLNVFNRKHLSDYDGQLDDLLYRGPALSLVKADVVDIPSDHNAVIGVFDIS
jgi:endonuclease/exonuclease/phosphatase family metal-dependent hydrolase